MSNVPSKLHTCGTAAKTPLRTGCLALILCAKSSCVIFLWQKRLPLTICVTKFQDLTPSTEVLNNGQENLQFFYEYHRLLFSSMLFKL